MSRSVNHQKANSTSTIYQFFNKHPIVQEGLYSALEGKGQNLQDRLKQQEIIKDYIDTIFGTKSELNFEDFVKIIQKKSSDLFF